MKAHQQRPSETRIKVAPAVRGVHTHRCIERVRRGARVRSSAEQMLKHGTSVGVLVGPVLNLSGRQSRGRQDARVAWIRALWTVLTMLGHRVGQLRDAGDETRVQFVAVVIL